MKRIFSICLIVALVLSSLSIPAVVTATENQKVFSLDLSGAEAGTFATTGTVKNGVTNSADGITVQKYSGAPANVTGPQVKTDITSSGQVIKYLTFANEAVAGGTWNNNEMWYGNVNIDNATIKALLEDDSTMSVEFWAKRHANGVRTIDTITSGVIYRSSHSGRLFRYGTHIDGSSTYDIGMEIYLASASGGAWEDVWYYYRPIGATVQVKDGDAIGGSIGNTNTAANKYQVNKNGIWDHYVLTKEFIPDNENVGTEAQPSGDYVANVYFNGALKCSIDTSTSASFAGKDVLKQDISNPSFTIGGRTQGESDAEDIFDGGIAEFNIYNYALNESEVTANYGAKQAMYKNIVKAPAEISLTTTEFTNISPLPGELTVNLNHFADKETLDGNVMIYDELGNPIPGGVVVTADSDYTNTFKVKYGRLKNNANYTLKVLSGVGFHGGATLASDLVASITTSQPQIFFSWDYEDAPLGVIDSANNSLYGIATRENGALCSIVELSDGNGNTNKALQLGDGDGDGTPAGNVIVQGWMDSKNQGNGFGGKSFTYEIEYKTVGSIAAKSVNFVYNPGWVNLAIGVPGAGSSIETAGWVTSTSGSYDKTTTDAFGFYNIKQSYIMGDSSYSIYTTNKADAENKVLTTNANSTINNIVWYVVKQYTSEGQGYTQIGKLKAYETSPLTVFKTPEYSCSSGTFSFVVTDDVVESTLSNLKVTDEGGNVIAGTPSYNAQSRTITYNFNETPINHGTINVSMVGVDSELSGISNHTFTVSDETYVPTMSVVSASNTTSISPYPGSLEITFSEAIDSAYLKRNIVILDDGDSEINGGVILSLSQEDSSKVIVKYGSLSPDSTYTLKVKKSIQSEGGLGLASDFEKPITTTGREYYLNFDFTNETARVLDSSEYSKYAITTVATGGQVSIEEVSDGLGGTKLALQLGNPKDSSGNYVTPAGDHIFQKVISGYARESFVYEVEYRAEGPSSSRTMNWCDTSSWGFDFGACLTAGGALTNPTGSSKAYIMRTDGSYDKETKDAFGFYGVKQSYVMEEHDAADVKGGIAADTGDLANKSYTIYTTNVNDSQKSVLKSETRNLNDLYGLKIHQYVAAAGGGFVQIGKIKAYKFSPLALFGDYVYNRTGKTLTFALTDDIVGTSYNNIKITNSYGAKIPGELAYDAAARKVTFTFSTKPNKNDVINISLEGVDTVNSGIANLKFKVSDAEAPVPNSAIVFTDQSGNTINSLASAPTSVKASFTIYNCSNEAVTPRNILAVYSGKIMKKMIIAQEVAQMDIGEEKAYTVTIDLSDITDVNLADCRLKLISLVNFRTLKPILKIGNATI